MKQANLTPVKAIHAFCVSCQGGHKKEVRFCPTTDCCLYPYRLGKNPNRQGVGGNPQVKSLGEKNHNSSYQKISNKAK